MNIIFQKSTKRPQKMLSKLQQSES